MGGQNKITFICSHLALISLIIVQSYKKGHHLRWSSLIYSNKSGNLTHTLLFHASGAGDILYVRSMSGWLQMDERMGTR